MAQPGTGMRNPRYLNRIPAPGEMPGQVAGRLAFNFYQNRNPTQVWGVQRLSVMIGANGLGSESRNFRVRTAPPPSTTPAGFYSAAFQLNMAYSDAASGDCTTMAGIRNFPLAVTANVASGCNLSVMPLDFGTLNHNLTARAIDATAQIQAHCTLGTPYHIGMDKGRAGSSPAARFMQGDGSWQVRYGIYRDAARQMPWGDNREDRHAPR